VVPSGVLSDLNSKANHVAVPHRASRRGKHPDAPAFLAGRVANDRQSGDHDTAMTTGGALVSDTEPISFRPHGAAKSTPPGTAGPLPGSSSGSAQGVVAFNRRELDQILNVYGRMVASGEWRDYAIDMGKELATFSIFRRASEFPLYRIQKNPKLARKQGAFSVVTATGLILKRGQELARVLEVFEKRVQLVVR